MQSLKLSPRGLIDHVVNIPGSKSYTNRALVLAAMADGESVLEGISLSDDALAVIAALEKLGVNIRIDENNAYVEGVGGKFFPYHGVIDVGPAGTAMRFLTALCSAIENCEVVLQGSERMHERPISELVNALRSWGADIQYLEKDGCPPLKIKGGSLNFSQFLTMKGSVSSQFFTALLLLAPLAKRVNIVVDGEQISKSYIDMSLGILEDFGLQVSNNEYRSYEVFGDVESMQYQVEGDASGASYFWGMAAINGGRVRVENISVDSMQGDIYFPSILESMGCKVRKREDWIEVQGPKRLNPTEVDMELMPDTAQTLAVVAAFAQGSTKITGLSTLKVKETDRLLALKCELKKMGIDSEIGDDFIVVHGGEPRGGVIETYHDHRMAMSFAMAASRIDGMEILNPEVVAKSFPNFWEECKKVMEIEGA